MTAIETINIEKPALNKKEAEFEKSKENKILTNIKNGAKFQDIMDRQGKIDDAFRKLTILACMDERVSVNIGGQEQGKIGIAGSLCLASEDDIDKFIKKYKGEIEIVTSHDDCGAAGMAFEDDAQNRYFVARLAEKLNAEYRHIEKKEMK